MISQLLDNWSNKMMLMLEVVKSKKRCLSRNAGIRRGLKNLDAGHSIIFLKYSYFCKVLLANFCSIYKSGYIKDKSY